MNAKKLPSGNWRARAYDKTTGRVKSFTAPTKKEAERLATSYEFGRGSSRLFADVAEKYIADREKILSPNTIKDYRISLRLHTDEIKNRKIDGITDSILQAWVNNLAETLSPKTVKNIYHFATTVIHSELPHASFSVTLPRKIKHDMEIPSEDELRKILGIVEGTNMEVVIKMAAFCCMRRGEISAVLNHKECIEDNSITVKYNIVKKGTEWIEKTPKSYASYRTIPCSLELAELARKAEPLNPGYITDHWIKLMKRMKLDYRFHDLRHFSASCMLSTGEIPWVDIEKIGGWRHGSTVLRDIYAHNMDESLRHSSAVWLDKISTLS